MRRRLFHLATAVSLVFACAAATLWVRSYIVRDIFLLGERAKGNAFDGSSWEAFAISTRGSLRLNLNLMQWQYTANPNPFPPNDGPSWIRVPPEQPYPVPVNGMGGHRPGIRAVGFDVWGFGVGRFASDLSAPGAHERRSHTAARMPLWVLALAFAIAPALALRRRLREGRRRRRRAAGQCTACGYDLRATPGTCPECGAVAAAARADVPGAANGFNRA